MAEKTVVKKAWKMADGKVGPTVGGWECTRVGMMVGQSDGASVDAMEGELAELKAVSMAAGKAALMADGWAVKTVGQMVAKMVGCLAVLMVVSTATWTVTAKSYEKKGTSLCPHAFQ